MQRLIDWSKQYPNTFINQHISLQSIDGFGYGGIALESTTEDEQDLIRIDLDLALSQQSAMKHPFGQIFHSCLHRIQNQSNGDVTALISELLSPSTGYEGSIHHHNNDMFDPNAILFYCFLVYQKFVESDKSFWFPYLDLLPDTFDTPLYYTQEELNELQGSNLIKSINSIKLKLSQIYELVIQCMCELEPQYFPIDKFTLNNFIWAYSAVWSRVFPIQYNDQVLPTLLPVIDILNHKFNESITYVTDVANNTFTLRSNMPILQGHQIFNNYGAKSNDSFLLSYGFVVENNIQDTLYIQLGVAGDEEQMQQKTEILLENNLSLGYYLNKSTIPDNLFKALRVCVLNEEELYYFNPNQIHDIVSFRNECQVLAIKNKLRQKLSNFPTSIEFDIQLLSQLNSQQQLSIHENRLRNILIYRIGQKEILMNAIDIVNNLENQLIQKLSNDIPKQLVSLVSEKAIIGSSNEFVQQFNESENTSLQVENQSNSLVMRTNTPIKTGQDIFKINLENIITMEWIVQSPIVSLISSLITEEQEELFDEESLFMLYLLYGKFGSQPDLRFSSFFKSMPDQFHCCLMFSEEELQELNDNSLIEETNELKNGLQQTFEQIVDFLSSVSEVYEDQDSFEQITEFSMGQVLTFKHFLWAYILFDSTVSRIESENPLYHDKPYILPIAALHTPHIVYNVSKRIDKPWFDESDQSIRVTAVTPFEENEIIATNAFAEKSHDELLLRYGIVFDPSDFSQRYSIQTYAVELDEELAQALTEEKLQIVQILHLGWEHLLRANTIPLKLINMLKLCFMTEDEAHRNLKRLETSTDLYTFELQTHTDISSVLNQIIPSADEEDQNNDHPHHLYIHNYRASIQHLIQTINK
jgi:hypothetical protein